MIVRLKDEFHNIIPLLLVSFNSMIVRLKAIALRQYSLAEAKFQFYDSPIKSQNSPAGAIKQEDGFNSMIVRLKETSKGDSLL